MEVAWPVEASFGSVARAIEQHNKPSPPWFWPPTLPDQRQTNIVIELFPAAADGSYELAAYRAGVFCPPGWPYPIGMLVYFGARDPLKKS